MEEPFGMFWMTYVAVAWATHTVEPQVALAMHILEPRVAWATHTLESPVVWAMHISETASKLVKLQASAWDEMSAESRCQDEPSPLLRHWWRTTGTTWIELELRVQRVGPRAHWI